MDIPAAYAISCRRHFVRHAFMDHQTVFLFMVFVGMPCLYCVMNMTSWLELKPHEWHGRYILKKVTLTDGTTHRGLVMVRKIKGGWQYRRPTQRDHDHNDEWVDIY